MKFCRLLPNISLHVVFLFCLFSQSVSAQNVLTIDQLPPKWAKMYRTAVKENKHGEYEKALRKFNKLLQVHPDFADAYTRKANVLYNLKQVDEAIDVLDLLIQKFPDHDPESYFTRGYMLFEQKNFERSHPDFASYLNRATLDEKRKSRVVFLYETAFLRDSLMRHPVTFTPQLLSDNINSDHSEYSPSLSMEGNVLVFTRRKNNQEDLLMAVKDSSGNFGPAVYLTEINTPANEGAHCVSADGTMVLFTGCDRDVLFRGCDLYYSVLRDDAWTKPSNIGKSINTPAWESQPCLTADGKTLFFVSDRVGGLGGRDIWYCKKNERGVWTEPANLGSPINTSNDDETPFLHPDGKTLYWRSNGRIGMGDFDIYTAKWNEDKQVWENIKNLGYPINTEGSEGGLVVSLDGRKAYFSTDAFSSSDEKKSNLDLCSFDLPPFARAIATTFIKIQVLDSVSRQPVTAEINIQNLRTNSIFNSGKTSALGQFLTPLHGKNRYAVHVFKEGYIFHSEYIDLDSVYSSESPFMLNILLKPVSKTTRSAPVVLYNLFFRTGSFEILPESEPEITRLFALLTENPEIKILVVGHTDNVGEDQQNMILSRQRADAVKNKLLSKGIAPDRIDCEGKGETEPVADNTTDEGRRQNRRTEFIVLRSE